MSRPLQSAGRTPNLPTSLTIAVFAAKPWTASRCAPWTASTRARTCSSSILTNASTVAFANRNAPSMPSRLIANPGLRNGCRSMRNTQESGQILRSKKRPRRTLRSGRGSRINSNTSRQIPARVIDSAYDNLPASTPKRRARHQHRNAHFVAAVFVAEDIDQVALFQQDADEDIGRGHCREQQVPDGHGRGYLKRDDKAQIPERIRPFQ